VSPFLKRTLRLVDAAATMQVMSVGGGRGALRFNVRLFTCPNTSARSSSFLLIAVLFTAAPPGPQSRDISIELARGHYSKIFNGGFWGIEEREGSSGLW
jgi:hypothetical protein